jgi:long-chain acyl-CoA synthetase
VWDGGQLSHRDVDLKAGGFARFLAAQGLAPGQALALAIGNRWTFPVALLGALKRGLTVAPLDVRLAPDERRAVLDDLQPAAVAHEVLGDEVEWAAEPTSGPALVLYTSGSTGRPKGAVLSHRALAAALGSWAGPVLGLRPDDVVLGVLPLSHSYGLNGALLAALLAGARVVLLERFTPDAVVAAIARHRVTVFPGVATMFRRLLASPALDPAALGSLRLAVSGAAPCPWDLAEAWRARTGVRILRGYGMTELFRPISYLAGDRVERPGAIGRPVPGVEIRVVGDDGAPVGDGEPGELLIRSPAALDGYLGAPDETAAVLREGWFHTGDLATVSPEGFVTIVGRKRERILRGGYSVFPPEVEAVLLAHPAVAEAAVVAVPDPQLGEEVAAFVVLHPGADAGPDALVAWCRDRLAAFKHPRHVWLRDALPRSSTGKVLKAELVRPGGSAPPG